MWRLLHAAGVSPRPLTCVDDERLPIELGVGFTDLGHDCPGTNSAAFKRDVLRTWRAGLFERLRGHVRRAAATAAGTAPAALPDPRCGGAGGDGGAVGGGTSGGGSSSRRGRAAVAAVAAAVKLEMEDAAAAPERLGYPHVIAFTGKRQWRELFFGTPEAEALAKKVDYGLQEARPPDWPFPPPQNGPLVVVLASSSGASALSNEARIAPYRLLAGLLRDVPWPHAAERSVEAQRLS